VEVFSFSVIYSSDGCINNNAAISCYSVVESSEAKSIPSVINVSKCGDIEWEIIVVNEFRLDKYGISRYEEAVQVDWVCLK
jgi:hypothetical protein